jgi:hypothetical protein
MTSGYSGTPLAKKLGIVSAMRVVLIDPPANYADILAPLPDGVRFVKKIDLDVDMVHVFTTSRSDLSACLPMLRQALNSQAFVWVSWPKQASKIPTSVNENTIRELALPLGFVDIKVCAVTEIWSGLKLVVRKELR